MAMSSTPRSRVNGHLINSSSPDIPSLGELLHGHKSPRRSPRKSCLHSGGNATPTSLTKLATTSAASLLRHAPEIDIDTEQVTYSPPRKAKLIEKLGVRVEAKAKVSAPSANIAGSIATPDLASSSKPEAWKKFRAPKSATGQGQLKLPKARVIKPVVVPDNCTKAKKATTEKVSKHFAKVGKNVEGKELDLPLQTRAATAADLQPQEKAIARREDWTPPPQNNMNTVGTEDDNTELLSSVGGVVASKEVFSNLFNDYAHQGREDQVTRNSVPSVPVLDLRKRKRIGLVASNDTDVHGEPSADALGEKPAAAVKKKARTITELATAPYQVPVDPTVGVIAPASKQSLLKYFDSDGAVTALVEHQCAVMEHKADAKGKKPAKARKRKKAGTAEDPILLSPGTALKQTSAQDFVFGTSSQLLVEESPSVIRDLQAAMQASNRPEIEDEDDPFASSPAVRSKRHRLWQASARDDGGDLLEAEVVDVADKGAVDTPPDQTDGCKYDGHADFVDIQDICPEGGCPISGSSPCGTAQPRSHFFQTQINVQYSAVIDMAVGASEADFEPPPSSQPRPGEVVTTAPRPKYEIFTDAQLARQINSYGFKPVKKRQAMIALLDQCWNSEHPGEPAGNAAAMSTSASARSPKKTCPKKPAPKGESAATCTPDGAVEPVKKCVGRRKKKAETVVPSGVTDDATPDGAVEPAKKRVGRSKKAETTAPSGVMDQASPKRKGRAKKAASKADSAVLEQISAVIAPIGESAPVAPKRRKKAVGKTIEVADSDGNEAQSPPSSPNTSADHSFSSPMGSDLSCSDEADTSLNVSPTDQETILFSHITQAVTTAPRSKDPAKPSWYEKMLMYDPVILEELAAWLNMGELTRVGYDGEVSAVEVKRWCESKSVICLWRVTHKNRERRRL